MVDWWERERERRETLRERLIILNISLFLSVLDLHCRLGLSYSRRAGLLYRGCVLFSLQRLLLRGARWGPGRRASVVGAWARLLGAVWDLPRPEIGPPTPALAERCTTEPPQKPETG